MCASKGRSHFLSSTSRIPVRLASQVYSTMLDNVFPFISALCIILLLIPLPFQLKTGSTAALALFSWLLLGNLVYFINSVIWANNVNNVAPVWCDISTKLNSIFTMGIPCASLCLLRRLEQIASTRQAHVTASEKRRLLIHDLSVSVGIPIIYAALWIVNQGHRFDIVESVGCMPTSYVTPAAIVMIILPPVIVGLVALIYAALTLRWFIIRRRQFNAVLQSSCSGLDRMRYLRLMGLASSEIIFWFPVNVVSAALRLKNTPIMPYDGWANVHYDFGSIEQYTAEFFNYDEDTKVSYRLIELSRWTFPVAALLMFAFFGTSREVKMAYHSWAVRLLRSFSRQSKPQDVTVSSHVPPALTYVTSSEWHSDDEETSFTMTPKTGVFPSSPDRPFAHQPGSDCQFVSNESA